MIGEVLRLTHAVLSFNDEAPNLTGDSRSLNDETPSLIVRCLSRIVETQNLTVEIRSFIVQAQDSTVALPNCIVEILNSIVEAWNLIVEVPNFNIAPQNLNGLLLTRSRDSGRADSANGSLGGRFGRLLLFAGFLKAFTQLRCDGFQTRRQLGGGLDVAVNLTGLLHRLPADRQSRIVNP